MAREDLGIGGFAARFLFSVALVFLTYNPAGWSYYHWAAHSGPGIDPLVVLAGITLVVGWLVYFNATFRSIGFVGMLLAAAFFATLIWLGVDRGWLHPDNRSKVVWLGLLVLAAVLGVGMTWSHIRRRLSGQTDVDQVDHR
jgi:hypothetical protein